MMRSDGSWEGMKVSGKGGKKELIVVGDRWDWTGKGELDLDREEKGK